MSSPPVTQCVPRCFQDYVKGHRQITQNHIGTHPLVMSEMIKHPRFRGELGKVTAALRRYMHEGPSDTEPFTVAVFCRAGEKRSVAMATFLYHCLRWGMGMEMVGFHHLTDIWRGTCRGTCPDCRESRLEPTRPDVTTAMNWFHNDMEQKFK